MEHIAKLSLFIIAATFFFFYMTGLGHSIRTYLSLLYAHKKALKNNSLLGKAYPEPKLLNIISTFYREEWQNAWKGGKATGVTKILFLIIPDIAILLFVYSVFVPQHIHIFIIFIIAAPFIIVLAAMITDVIRRYTDTEYRKQSQRYTWILFAIFIIIAIAYSIYLLF